MSELYPSMECFDCFNEIPDNSQLNLLVNNVFDEQFISNGYFFTFDDDFSVPGEVTTIEGAGFYPQAGINFLVGTTLTF